MHLPQYQSSSPVLFWSSAGLFTLFLILTTFNSTTYGLVSSAKSVTTPPFITFQNCVSSLIYRFFIFLSLWIVSSVCLFQSLSFQEWNRDKCICSINHVFAASLGKLQQRIIQSIQALTMILLHNYVLLSVHQNTQICVCFLANTSI